MDFKKAAAALTKKTRALILVHLYGQMVDPAVAEIFCKANDLILIEDTAQAFGSAWKGRPAGSLGLASCISFDPTKPISAPGSGGILLTDDEKIAQQVKRLRYHGRAEGQAAFLEPGYNAQMPTTTAAVLNFKLTQAETWLRRRREIAKQYHASLRKVAEITLPTESIPDSHNYHKYVVRTPDRDALKATLAAASVETFVHYQAPLHRQPMFDRFDYEESAYPRSIEASQQVLSLPIHPYLQDDEIETITQTITQHFHQNPRAAARR
jgi:dTDP-4-amino-4,6-dideoxygalactose transaminase